MPRIRVLFDVWLISALKTAGFGTTKVAGAFQFAAAARAFKNGEATGENIYEVASEDSKAWVEPSTGVILLKPRAMYSDFMENPAFEGDRYGLDEFDTGTNAGGGTLFLGLPRRKTILMRREDKDADITFLSVQPAFQAVVGLTCADMGFTMKSKNPLLANEGFGVKINPHGTPEDSAGCYFGALFGNKFYIDVRMNGFAYFYENVGTMTDWEWVLRETMAYNAGGVSHTKPFQLYVVPFGKSFIGIYFSQSQTAPKGVRSTKSFKRAAFLYDISKYSRVEPAKDVALGQYIKTPAANLYLSMRKATHHYQFQPFRLRYPEDADVTLMPEQLGEKRPYDPAFTPYGYDGGGTSIETLGLNNEKAVAYDKNRDYQVSPRFRLKHSTGPGSWANVYTPELWYYDLEVSAETTQPPIAEFDISDRWTQIRFSRGVDPEHMEGHIKLNEDDLLFELYKKSRPIRIEIDGVSVFDGFAFRPHKTLSGITAPQEIGGVRTEGNPPESFSIETEWELRDIWLRLENTPIMESTAIDGKRIETVVTNRLRRAGFVDTEIEIAADAADIRLEGFTENNSVKTFNEDTKVADVFREIIKKFGFQNRSYLRILWVPQAGKWRCYFATEFIEGITANPKKIFVLDDTIPYFPRDVPDQVRWADTDGDGDPQDCFFKVTSKPEIISNESPFNALKVTTATGADDQAAGLQVVIPPHPAVMAEGSSVPGSFYLYEGIVRPDVIGPPEITATDEKALSRQGRLIFDQAQRDQLVWTFDGEWQPHIDVDDLIMIYGRDNVGSQVSFGVFRIEAIDVTISRDISPGVAIDESSWSWSANYTVIYIGKPDGRTMFVSPVLLPPPSYIT